MLSLVYIFLILLTHAVAKIIKSTLGGRLKAFFSLSTERLAGIYEGSKAGPVGNASHQLRASSVAFFSLRDLVVHARTNHKTDSEVLNVGYVNA